MRGHVGLSSRARLARLYDGAATLTVRPNAAAGTMVELTLPVARAIAAGHPADEEPYLELRDDSKLQDKRPRTG